MLAAFPLDSSLACGTQVDRNFRHVACFQRNQQEHERNFRSCHRSDLTFVCGSEVSKLPGLARSFAAGSWMLYVSWSKESRPDLGVMWVLGAGSSELLLEFYSGPT